MHTLKLLMDRFRFGSPSSGRSTGMARLADAAMPRGSDRLRVWQSTHGLRQGRRLMAEREPPTDPHLSYASSVSWRIWGGCPIGAGFAESTTEHRAGLLTGHLAITDLSPNQFIRNAKPACAVVVRSFALPLTLKPIPNR